MDALRRLVRHLIGCPRLVRTFFHQQDSQSLITDVDTDVAGCLDTRRSTSGGIARRGNHLLKHWSVTQTTVNLSSAETELVGICQGTSISLGLISVARDLGLHWSLCVRSDASAAIGVCRRRGLGKLIRRATADLWIQDRLRCGDCSLDKIPGSENASDMLAKHVDRHIRERHLPATGLRTEQGRAELAPTLEIS